MIGFDGSFHGGREITVVVLLHISGYDNFALYEASIQVGIVSRFVCLTLFFELFHWE